MLYRTASQLWLQHSPHYPAYFVAVVVGIGLANKVKAYNLQDEDGLDTIESNIRLGYAPDCRDFADARRVNSSCRVTSGGYSSLCVGVKTSWYSQCYAVYQ